MIELKYFNNFDEAILLYAALGEKLAPEMSMALNRASRALSAEVKRQIIAESDGKLRKSDLKDWSFRNARPGSLDSVSIFSGSRFGIEKFVPDLKSTRKARPKAGLTVDLPFGQRTIKGGFVADVYRYGLGLQAWTRGIRVGDKKNKKKREPVASYEEVGGRKRYLRGRFPVAHLTFMAGPQMAENPEVVEMAVGSAQMQFLKQFDHRIDMLVKGQA